MICGRNKIRALLQENVQLTEENSQLTEENCQLSGEISQLMKEISELTEENAQLRDELELKNMELFLTIEQLEQFQETTDQVFDEEMKPVDEDLAIQVLTTEVIQDKLFPLLNLNDLKNLQLTSRRLNEGVMGHLPSWRKRKIIIDIINSDILNELDPEQSHLSWKAASLHLLQWNDDVERFSDLWWNLEHLELISREDTFDHCMNIAPRLLLIALSHCPKLKSLVVDQNLFWMCSENDIPAVGTALRKLTKLAFCGRFKNSWMMRSPNYEKNPMLQNVISTHWPNLSSLKLDLYPTFAHKVMCGNVLCNITDLTLSHWDHFDPSFSFPEMTKLRKLDIESFKIYDGHLADVLRTKAAFLTVIRVVVHDRCPLDVLKAVESHRVLLKSLTIESEHFETKREGTDIQERSILDFLSKCRSLRYLKLAVNSNYVRNHKHSQPQPTIEDIVSKLPRNLETLILHHFPTRVWGDRIRIWYNLSNHLKARQPKLQRWEMY